MSQSASHDATFYIQLKPEFARYGAHGQPPNVVAVKPVALTQKSPAQPKGGAILVKLTLRIPDSAFHPLRPEAVIVIPESMVQASLMLEVEVLDPREDHDEASPLS